MKASAVREAYRRERRSSEIPNFLREDLGTIVRYSPQRQDAEGLVCFANLSADCLAAEIRRQTEYFAVREIGFEWKVYGSDEPACLTDMLVDAGFERGEAETLMVYELSKPQSRARPRSDGIDVRRVDDISALRQIAEFQELIWGRSLLWLLDQLRSSWEQCTHFGAYDGRQLVGTGWIEYPKGSQFAELHGGAVLPAYRGRGIYSRVFEARAADARARGLRWLAVDAAPMSGPILEAKGCERLDVTIPMNWPYRHAARREQLRTRPERAAIE
jgi:GNAT superfamily N-acetyltransferase